MFMNFTLKNLSMLSSLPFSLFKSLAIISYFHIFFEYFIMKFILAIKKYKMFYKYKIKIQNNNIRLIIPRYSSSDRFKQANVLLNLQDELQSENTSLDSPYHFKNIQVINPRIFSSFFYNKFKLKFVQPEHSSHHAPGIEVLRNICANYDYWIVRNNQTHLLYYRLELLMQRINFLQSVGLDKRQKLRLIGKYPPLLLLSFTDVSYDAKLVYLRGLLPQDQLHSSFIHLFYPVTSKLTLAKDAIKSRVASIEENLGIKQTAALRLLLNLPCFFMEPSLFDSLNHKFVHKYSMPFYYDRDQHTAPIFPPICDLPKLGLSTERYFSNKSTNNLIGSLPSYKIQDILDVSYPTCNGKGTPESLSKFLIRAEFEEEKDRTGGQPMKGIRGFNVPARQY